MDDKVIFGNICSRIMSQLFIAEANIISYFTVLIHVIPTLESFFSGSAKDG